LLVFSHPHIFYRSVIHKLPSSLNRQDSVKAHQIDIRGAFKFETTLAERDESDGKAGVFALKEMGSFFITERIPSFIEYEQDLTKKINLTFKATCTYHRDDFANPSKEQQETILSAHNRVSPKSTFKFLN
jgi:hypothetical protein